MKIPVRNSRTQPRRSADVVRIREQQDRRIDDRGNVIELDIKQVVQSPDHEGAVTSAEYMVNATQRAGKGQYARRMVDPQDLIPNFRDDEPSKRTTMIATCLLHESLYGFF